MTNNINLKSSDSIILELSTDNKTLSIKINEAVLDAMIADLIKDDTSATYNAIKEKLADKFDGKYSSEFAAKSHTHTVANITDLKYGTGNKSGTIFIKY